MIAEVLLIGYLFTRTLSSIPDLRIAACCNHKGKVEVRSSPRVPSVPTRGSMTTNAFLGGYSVRFKVDTDSGTMGRPQVVKMLERLCHVMEQLVLVTKTQT
ncbi:hypothetical protein LZ30DRAFT_688739 [Colletotrichum cereale]|nr:hypothetical protein LZ30DRAFT_688739 [Colletotrichum cereale]